MRWCTPQTSRSAGSTKARIGFSGWFIVMGAAAQILTAIGPRFGTGGRRSRWDCVCGVVQQRRGNLGDRRPLPSRADRCSRQPCAPRAHAGQVDISAWTAREKPRGLFTVQCSGDADAFCVFVNSMSAIHFYYRHIVCKLHHRYTHTLALKRRRHTHAGRSHSGA